MPDRLLVQVKQRQLGEVSGWIETTIRDLHAMLDARELGHNRGSLKDTLDGLLLDSHCGNCYSYRGEENGPCNRKTNQT